MSTLQCRPATVAANYPNVEHRRIGWVGGLELKPNFTPRRPRHASVFSAVGLNFEKIIEQMRIASQNITLLSMLLYLIKQVAIQ